MTTYKLTYFDIMGRAELTRMLFAHAGVAFEDERINRETWMKRKPDSVFGQLPILQIDGVSYCQSAVINGYLAQKFGLAGKTPLDGLKVAMVGACIGDILAKFPFFEANKEVKDKAFADALNNTVPPLLKKMEAMMEGKLFVCQLSSADIGWSLLADFLVGEKADILKDVPKLKACADTAKAHPNIAAYIKKRDAKKQSFT